MVRIEERRMKTFKKPRIDDLTSTRCKISVSDNALGRTEMVLTAAGITASVALGSQGTPRVDKYQKSVRDNFDLC